MVEALNREDSSLACLVFQFFSAVDSLSASFSLNAWRIASLFVCLIAGSITHLRRCICRYSILVLLMLHLPLISPLMNNSAIETCGLVRQLMVVD